MKKAGKKEKMRPDWIGPVLRTWEGKEAAWQWGTYFSHDQAQEIHECPVDIGGRRPLVGWGERLPFCVFLLRLECGEYLAAPSWDGNPFSSCGPHYPDRVSALRAAVCRVIWECRFRCRETDDVGTYLGWWSITREQAHETITWALALVGRPAPAAPRPMERRVERREVVTGQLRLLEAAL